MTITERDKYSSTCVYSVLNLRLWEGPRLSGKYNAIKIPLWMYNTKVGHSI